MGLRLFELDTQELGCRALMMSVPQGVLHFGGYGSVRCADDTEANKVHQVLRGLTPEFERLCQDALQTILSGFGVSKSGPGQRSTAGTSVAQAHTADAVKTEEADKEEEMEVTGQGKIEEETSPSAPGAQSEQLQQQAAVAQLVLAQHDPYQAGMPAFNANQLIQMQMQQLGQHPTLQQMFSAEQVQQIMQLQQVTLPSLGTSSLRLSAPK